MKNQFKSLASKLFPNKEQVIKIEYKVEVKPRYGYGKPPHQLLYELINQNRKIYKEILESFLNYIDNIQSIKKLEDETDENKPAWNNKYLPGLDIIGIYGIISKFKPAKYIEIGSGNSTKVARKAIIENNLNTEIVSIDPFPRTNIDKLADKIIKEQIENLSDYKFITDSLKENDILFIDGSHFMVPNSDVLVCFLELLPNLNKGVIVHVHDIYLPYDYPQFMCDRYYNEEYILGAFILANPEKYKTIFPNFFISEDKELSNIISGIWEHPNLLGVEKHGGSFWLQINQ